MTIMGVIVLKVEAVSAPALRSRVAIFNITVCSDRDSDSDKT